MKVNRYALINQTQKMCLNRIINKWHMTLLYGVKQYCNVKLDLSSSTLYCKGKVTDMPVQLNFTGKSESVCCRTVQTYLTGVTEQVNLSGTVYS